jgi:2-oxoglutarate dehydrogenase E2 component (dihydrolipoamide succinyltransferase)
MKVEIKVPAMGESISQATIGAILKANGSVVTADEEIVELETEKVNQILYAPKSGLLTFSVSTDDVVKIGQVIGFVDTEAAAGKAAAPKEAKSPEKKAEVKAEKEAQRKPEPKTEEKSAKKAITEPSEEEPSALPPSRLGREEYLKSLQEAPSQIETAPAPEKAAAEPRSEASRETRRRMTTIRRVIAKRLVEAQSSMAMLTTFNEVDLTEIVALREKYKEIFSKKYGVKLGFMSFFVKAVVHALQAFPELNSYIDGDHIVHREYYDIGVAVGTERGLVVPVLRDCDQKSFPEIEKAIESYAAKARDGSLSIDDLQGGGFTITNGGTYGSLLSTPIVNPPQCGILGMHKIQKRAVVVNDAIVIRSMMYLALSYDHRVVDGKEAVSFLVEVKNTLESPARLLLDI